MWKNTNSDTNTAVFTQQKTSILSLSVMFT